MTEIHFIPIAFQCGPIFDIGGKSYTDPDCEIYYGYLLNTMATEYGNLNAIDAMTGNVIPIRRMMPIDKFLPPPTMIFAYDSGVVVIR